MGKRDAQYGLSGIIELDGFFFSLEIKEDRKGKTLKRGWGSQKKSKVPVMAESIPVKEDDRPCGKGRKVHHIKMFVIDDLKATTIDCKVS